MTFHTGPSIRFAVQFLVLSSFLLSLPGTLLAQPNHVLELDGHGSYVELPPNIFKDLEEATVATWVKSHLLGGLCGSCPACPTVRLAKLLRKGESTPMKQMTVTETARKFREVIQAVEDQGEKFIVVRKAQPVAGIVPEPPPQTALEVKGDLYLELPPMTWQADSSFANE